MTTRRSTTINPSNLAFAIISCSIVGFIVSSWALSLPSLSTLHISLIKIFRHGCEGAFVGGICDFIAVRMVYETARREFEQLQSSTANIVVKDMVNLRQKIEDVSQIQDALQDPEFQKELIRYANEWIPSQAFLRAEMFSFWNNYLREGALEWLLDIDLSAELKEQRKNQEIQQEVFRKAASKILTQVADEDEENRLLMKKIQDLTEDLTLAEIGIPSEEEGIRHLLFSIWEAWKNIGGFEERSVLGLGKVSNLVIGALASRAAPLVKKTTVQQILGPLLSERTVREGLIAFAKKLDETPTSSEKTNQVFEDFIGYSAVFLRAWNNLPDVEKKEVLDELFRIIEGRLIDRFSLVLWQLWSQLLSPSSLLEKRWVKDALQLISERIVENAAIVEQKAIEKLNDEFKAMGKDGFVDMIKSRTQRQLDWIKVNGSGWGFIIGMLAGCLTLLFS